MQRVTFFYPSRVIGGAEFLFIRLARKLSEEGWEVFIVDYPDGFIIGELKHLPIQLVPFTQESPVHIPPETTLIIPAMVSVSLHNLVIPPETRLINFCMDKFSYALRFPQMDYTPPLDFTDLRRQLAEKYPRDQARMSEILGKMAEKRGIIFLESTSILVNQLLFDMVVPQPEVSICPNCCQETALVSLRDQEIPVQPDSINIGWLGRLSFEKIFCILFILEHLIYYHRRHNTPIRFHIIGTGEYKAYIDQIPIPPGVEIIYTGDLINEELDFYLKHKVDILFAMGTSLLEGAKLRIPTVIIDSSLVPIPVENKLAWLFESHDYLLGEYSGSTRVERKHSFEEILEVIYGQQRKTEYGNRCYDYFRANHSLEVSAQKLIQQIQACRFDATDFQNHNYFEMKIIPPAVPQSTGTP